MWRCATEWILFRLLGASDFFRCDRLRFFPILSISEEISEGVWQRWVGRGGWTGVSGQRWVGRGGWAEVGGVMVGGVGGRGGRGVTV